MKLIPLHGEYGEGRITKISDCDFEFVSNLKLYVNDGYVKTYYKRRHWKLHQLLVGSNYDHINRDPLDNTRENLRPATTAQNNANVMRRAGSGYKGVYPDKSTGHWRTQISSNGKMLSIGNFQNKHYAALAYDLWAVDLYGEFARTNFTVVERVEKS